MNLNELIFNNFGLKATALFLAVTVWIFISGEEQSLQEKNFEANVEFYNVSDNIDVNARPEKVRVKIRGTTRVISEIPENAFKMKIDLEGISRSTILNLLSEDYLEVPGGIDLGEVAIHPKMISITVKEFLSKEVTVKIRTRGRPKKGIKLLELKAIPEKVRIYGYRSEVTAINTVYTASTIDLNGLTENTKIKMILEKREEILKFEDTDQVEANLLIENKNAPDPKKRP